MIRSQNGTSRATSLETERKHGASETEKGEAVAARGTPGRQQNAPFTSVASGEATDKKFENTCRRRACRTMCFQCVLKMFDLLEMFLGCF